MKKIFLTILITFAFISLTFGQEVNPPSESVTESSVGFSSDDSSSSSSDFSGLRIGGAFSFETTLGDLSDFVGIHLGGGVQAEYDIKKIPLPDFMKLGISAKVMANFGFLKDDILLSIWNLQVAPGIYCRFSFMDESFAIQPEISYGVQMNFLEQNPIYNNKIEKMYLDQIIEVAVGIRYAPPKLLGGALEFGVTPFFIYCPEQNYSAQYTGASIFIFYKF